MKLEKATSYERVFKKHVLLNDTKTNDNNNNNNKTFKPYKYLNIIYF